MKENLEFFTHDTNSFEDLKFLALRAQYGWEGEGRFWALNCIIAREAGGILDLNQKFVRPSCAQKLGMSLEDFNNFIQCLLDECELIFEKSPGVITTKRVQQDLQRVTRDRDTARARKSEKHMFGGGSLEKIKSSPELSQSSPEKNTEQSREENIREQASIAEDISLSPRARGEQPPCQPACLPALNLKIRERIRTAPFPSSFTDQDYEDFTRRLTARDLDLAFVDFCITKAVEKNAKKPAGLFKLGLITYDNWIDEFLWKPAPQGKEPYTPYKLPEVKPPDEQTSKAFASFAQTLRKKTGVRAPPARSEITT